MKAKEAKAIIRNILAWQMVLMGVTAREDLEVDESIDLSKYSLQELLDANKKVEECNKKAKNAQQLWKNRKGTSKGINLKLTCADRLIAATYVALHYPPNKELISLYDDKGCGVVKAEY